MPNKATAVVPEALAVAAGYYHTCAVTSGGGVKCWGSNSSGQLGDGTRTSRSTPGDVIGLTSGVDALTTGGYHACALTSAGGVKCWGANFAGQLGDGTTTTRLTPVDASGLTTGVVAISAGYGHSCAVTDGGALKCWGRNDEGQLGDGTTTSRTTPQDVSGLSSGIVVVSSGAYHTCAVTGAGGAKCWGANASGELGDGTTTPRSTPGDVSDLTGGAAAVAAGGSHTCAVTSAGGVKAP